MILFLGDSRTANNSWPLSVTNALDVATDHVWSGYNKAQSGLGVETTVPLIDGFLAAAPANGEHGLYRFVLINLGVNGVTDEATWEADYLTIIDKVHAKAPDAKIYLMRPWMAGWDAGAATIHGWIDTVVGSRTFTYVGPDEAIWLKGADNGASETVDGVHYSALGESLCAAQWQTVLGY